MDSCKQPLQTCMSIGTMTPAVPVGMVTCWAGKLSGHRASGLGVLQSYSAISRSGIEWEQATLRGKIMPLLMEWDASRPHTQVRPLLVVTFQGGVWPALA